MNWRVSGDGSHSLHGQLDVNLDHCAYVHVHLGEAVVIGDRVWDDPFGDHFVECNLVAFQWYWLVLSLALVALSTWVDLVLAYLFSSVVVLRVVKLAHLVYLELNLNLLFEVFDFIFLSLTGSLEVYHFGRHRLLIVNEVKDLILHLYYLLPLDWRSSNRHSWFRADHRGLVENPGRLGLIWLIFLVVDLFIQNFIAWVVRCCLDLLIEVLRVRLTKW